MGELWNRHVWRIYIAHTCRGLKYAREKYSFKNKNAKQERQGDTIGSRWNSQLVVTMTNRDKFAKEAWPGKRRLVDNAGPESCARPLTILRGGKSGSGVRSGRVYCAKRYRTANAIVFRRQGAPVFIETLLTRWNCYETGKQIEARRRLFRFIHISEAGIEREFRYIWTCE